MSEAESPSSDSDPASPSPVRDYNFHPASVVARHWPFPNGSGRILDRYARQLDLGSGERIAQTSDGFPMRVYADDLIGRYLLLSGEFHRSVIQVLIDQAQAGDVLLDIGANVGYYSAVFLMTVPDSVVQCFEPQPGVVDLLRSNMAQFGDRATIEQFGLADQDGTFRFHVNPVNRGEAMIRADGELAIPVRAAGTVLRSIPRADLIKIDVEGFEGLILRAIRDELERLRPRAILFEDKTQSAHPSGDIGEILNQAEYGIYGIRKRLLRTDLVPIRSRSDCHFNDYLAIAT